MGAPEITRMGVAEGGKEMKRLLMVGLLAGCAGESDGEKQNRIVKYQSLQVVTEFEFETGIVLNNREQLQLLNTAQSNMHTVLDELECGKD